MKIVIAKNYTEMSKHAASLVINQILSKPNSVLGLATGSTPIGMYQELINSYNLNEVDFSQIITFNLDEYYELDKTNSNSYYSFMIKHFINYVNIKKENFHIPNGLAEDIEKECSDYEEKILDSSGIDLQILGIGQNGHIGFNEPNISFEATTHLVNLDSSTIKANSKFFHSIDEVPTKAISIGMRTIIQAKQIILLASGLNKADAIKKAIEGKILSEVPASILQLHSNVTFIIDEAAASKLTKEVKSAYC